MNTSDRLKRLFRNPKLLIRGLNRVYHRRGGLQSENPSGIDIFSEDWDTLVILDACRYDMFDRINQIDGILKKKESKASATVQWLRANFHGRDLQDTVYVTANPQLERHKDKKIEVNLHEIINVWNTGGWDEDLDTVLAETVTDAAIDAYNQFPKKRLVVHYMQPHYPFVPIDKDFGCLDSVESADNSTSGKNIWNQKFLNNIHVSDEDIWDMYNANLEYVLEHVERLISEIPGKTVISSDHGNYVGERASLIPIHEYGHPRGLYDKPVVCIPWLECTSGDRREIVTEPSSAAHSETDSETVKNRLQNLGYVN